MDYTHFKQIIDNSRDILMGKLPSPIAQVDARPPLLPAPSCLPMTILLHLVVNAHISLANTKSIVGIT